MRPKNLQLTHPCCGSIHTVLIYEGGRVELKHHPDTSLELMRQEADMMTRQQLTLNGCWRVASRVYMIEAMSMKEISTLFTTLAQLEMEADISKKIAQTTKKWGF